MAVLTARTARATRTTRETDVSASVVLDGTGAANVSTGIGFLDHMLTALALHSRIDIELRCAGDLAVDDHHTVEDSALVLGAALADALGDRKGIARFGSAYAPLDESLARAVVDCSGRPFARIALGLTREHLGELSCENIPHFFASFATAARITLHIDVLEGGNDHHRAEAAFKACALALRAAVARGATGEIASTKGTLS